MHDREFGAGFIKICSYFPYPAKLWVKRQAARAGIGFAELANGFASCTDSVGLQASCDRFGPADVQVFFDRWTRNRKTKKPLRASRRKPVWAMPAE